MFIFVGFCNPVAPPSPTGGALYIACRGLGKGVLATLVAVITHPGAHGTAITLGHAVALVTVTVDVVHAAVDTPPPIAMTGPTLAPDQAGMTLCFGMHHLLRII